MTIEQKRIISVLMENAPGGLSRVVGLFSQRGYNIDSLNVAPTNDTSLSRLTLTTRCDDLVIEQVTKQLNKLIDVVKVQDITEGSHIERELMMIKVRTRGDERSEVKRCADIFRGQIIDVGPNYYTVLVEGTRQSWTRLSKRSPKCVCSRLYAPAFAELLVLTRH